MYEEYDRFTFFRGGVFSQWHAARFHINGEIYNCTEQYMMAGKARLFGDLTIRAEIMRERTPKWQKRLGRKVKGFTVDEWDAHARAIVYNGNLAKYKQNPRMREQLLATKGTAIVEASIYDRIWGIVLHQSNPKSQNRETWEGRNWLGEVLTVLRDRMFEGIENENPYEEV